MTFLEFMIKSISKNRLETNQEIIKRTPDDCDTSYICTYIFIEYSE